MKKQQFHNLNDGDLADELGGIKAEIADLEEREHALRAELISRGITECEGSLFRATVSQSVRWTLNSKLVKQEMGQEWYDAHCNQTATTTVRINARTRKHAA